MGQEEKVEKSGIFDQKDLSELTPNKGDSIGFYFFSTDTRSGDDGEFMIAEGLMINVNAASIEALVETAEPINFIPRVVLENKINEGAFNLGNAYRLEKTINRGDEYKGKKVKYFAWDLFHIDAPADAIKALNDKILDLQGNAGPMASETAAKATKKKPNLD